MGETKMKRASKKTKTKKQSRNAEKELFSFCPNCGSLNFKAEDNPFLTRFGSEGLQCQRCGAVFSTLPQAPLSVIQQYASGRHHAKRMDEQAMEVHAAFSTMSLYYSLMLWGILMVTILMYVKEITQQLAGVLASTLFVWALLFILLHVSKKRRDHALKRNPHH